MSDPDNKKLREAEQDLLRRARRAQNDEELELIAKQWRDEWSKNLPENRDDLFLHEEAVLLRPPAQVEAPTPPSSRFQWSDIWIAVSVFGAVFTAFLTPSWFAVPFVVACSILVVIVVFRFWAARWAKRLLAAAGWVFVLAAISGWGFNAFFGEQTSSNVSQQGGNVAVSNLEETDSNGQVVKFGFNDNQSDNLSITFGILGTILLLAAAYHKDK